MWIAIIAVVILVVVAVIVVVMKGQPANSPSSKGRTQDQKDTEFIQRLCYLLKIAQEHSSEDRRQSSIREIVRIGESVHAEGGFRYMVKIHETVTQATSPKIGARLKVLWKGIGDWRS